MIGLTELAERCEAATGPDRELDEAILRSAYVVKHGQRTDLGPRFTASLDAALSLVPEGCGFMLSAYAPSVDPSGCTCAVDGQGVQAATPALALTAAALRARAASGMEAAKPSRRETGSTEGDSPTAESGDAQ